MRQITSKEIEQAIAELCLKANTLLPADVLQAI